MNFLVYNKVGKTVNKPAGALNIFHQFGHQVLT